MTETSNMADRKKEIRSGQNNYLKKDDCPDLEFKACMNARFAEQEQQYSSLN